MRTLCFCRYAQHQYHHGRLEEINDCNDPSSCSRRPKRESVIRFPNKDPMISHETAIVCSVMTQQHKEKDTYMPKDFESKKTQKQRMQCPVCLKTYARPGTLKVTFLTFNFREWSRENFSVQYQYNIKQTGDEKMHQISIFRLLGDPIPNSVNSHHKNCMTDSKDNY